jgi:transcriptional regulator GlxA family with amidase domain
MDQRVQAAIDFMNANLHRKLSPNEVADSVNLSTDRLRRIFKAETCQSLTAYRKRLQLERGKHLLETTFFSVKQIAAKSGLTEVSHFVRDFKKAYGLRPSEYAKRYRKILSH